MLLGGNIYAFAMRKLRYCDVKAWRWSFCSVFPLLIMLAFDGLQCRRAVCEMMMNKMRNDDG